MENTKISNKKIKEEYNLIKEYHEKYLKKYGIKMPKVYSRNGNFTMNALVLVYLSFGYSKTKTILYKFIN
ncbi:MAG: hypothetical protein QMD06_03495 [Candidatus Altarchaeum sp.]|nr:hypothetical protein [Candidatus Altarchaeum sp.]